LALAMNAIFQVDSPIQIIGTRHGEKEFETLLTREEMLRAVDLGGYYRVPADNRDLNYDAYFVEGSHQLSELADYNSHNTRRLNREEMVDTLYKLDYIRNEISTWRTAKVAIA
jgi:UDP-glucose 4-epimerase